MIEEIRTEQLKKAHELFDDRKLILELNWQRDYFGENNIISKQDILFNIWIFDECLKMAKKLQNIEQIVSEWNNDASHSFSDMCNINGILKEKLK